jgi:hypothetical protein
MSGMTYMFNSEEELAKMKERTTKVKVILLEKMGKHPLSNPKYLKQREKTQLLLKMKDYLDTKTDQEIDAEFNEICLDKLFDCDTDITSYPIYDLSKKEELEEIEDVDLEPTPKYSVVDMAGNSVHIPRSLPENLMINGTFPVEMGANAGNYQNYNFASSLAVKP